MLNKKIYINVLLQLIFFLGIIGLFYFNKIDLTNIKITFSLKSLYLISWIFLVKIIIATLFFLILKVIIQRHTNFFFISSAFFQGGLMEMLFPTSGLVYKYYKLNNNADVSLLEYSISQTILSVFSLICFFLIAFFFGFTKIIEFKSANLFIIFAFTITMAVIIYSQKKKLYALLQKKIIKFSKINNFFYELKKLKNIIFLKKKFFSFIFLSFFIKCFIECYIFYIATQTFGMEISLHDAFFIFISSILLEALILIKLIGIFEIILSLTTILITNEYMDMIYVGLSLRILNIICLIFWIIILSGIYYFSNNKKNNLK